MKSIIPSQWFSIVVFIWIQGIISYIWPLAEAFITYLKQKKTVVVIIQLIIACLFIIGADWTNDTLRRMFHSYFADIAIPFGFYFLLVLIEDSYKRLQNWYIKVAVVFTLCSTSETLQLFGIYALAKVFDPLDYVMYALGVVLAAIVDKIILKRLLEFW